MITIISLFVAGVCLLDAHRHREQLREAERRLHHVLKTHRDSVRSLPR